MRPVRFFFLLTALLPFTLGAAQKDPEALHQKYCLACHTPALYTRPDRAIHTKAALERQVRLCQGRQNLRWSDETIQSVADYLDTTYYRLER